MRPTYRSGLTFYAEAALPTSFGSFRIRVYRSKAGDEPVAMFKGSIAEATDVPVRVHSACFTSETLHSRRCDCREQLEYSLRYIQEHHGVIIYLHQEGRGIGLGNKIRAYALQEKGYDTISANEALHLPVDTRSYEDVASILHDLRVKSIRLMTNNPDKERGLIALGVRITGRIPVVVPANEFSRAYLLTKEARMGHVLHLGRNPPSPSEVGLAPTAVSSRNRPYVHLNFALGRESQPPSGAQISSPEDWSRVHALRERYTAIAVGAETWMRDRPRLTARREHLGREPFRQPRRIVFAGNHVIRFLQVSCPDFVVGSRKPRLPGGRMIRASGHALGGPLAALCSYGVASLLVEGGPRLWKSFLTQQLADEITIFVAADSEELASRLALQQFPDLPGPLRSERFGRGVILRWQANLEPCDSMPATSARDAFLPGLLPV